MTLEAKKAARTGRKVALVTGAARRIGREIALMLAENGYDIAIHCRSFAVKRESQGQNHYPGTRSADPTLSDADRVLARTDMALPERDAKLPVGDGVSRDFESDGPLAALRAEGGAAMDRHAASGAARIRVSEGAAVFSAQEWAGLDPALRVLMFEADLTDWTAVRALVPAVVAQMGAIDLLVNSASQFEHDAVGGLDLGLWRSQMAVNLEAPVFLAEAFAAQAPDGASIVNIVDQRVEKLTPQFFSYTLSKAALWTATQTLAQALAPRIRVNAIGPGPTMASTRQSSSDFAQQAAFVPLQRAVSPRELGAAVLYLAQAAAVTGQLLLVDGGQHLAWQTPDVSAVRE